MRPKISIISPVFNCVHCIEKSIQSVLGQTYKNFEYIIIDGGSTDGTIEILKKYENSITFWCTEKDDGIYDAMNKGILHANGEWFYFLGADDYLMNNEVFESLSKHLNVQYDMICGNVLTSNNRIINSKIGVKTLLHNTVCHQSAMYSRDLFNNWEYDTQFKIMADYELNLLIYLKKMSIKKVNIIFACYSTNGISSTLLKESYLETNRVRKKHLPGGINLFFEILYKIKFKIVYQ